LDSFGGLVIKNLVVEVGKRTSATTQNDFDIKTKMNCTRFLENLSGIVFYNVPSQVQGLFHGTISKDQVQYKGCSQNLAFGQMLTRLINK